MIGEIEKGIKLPTVELQYPLDKMQVGDSFKTDHRRNRVATFVTRFQKKTNTKFTIRDIGNDELRVWRTK